MTNVNDYMGDVRAHDSLGRVSIPIDWKRILFGREDLNPQTRLEDNRVELFCTPQGIIIKPYNPTNKNEVGKIRKMDNNGRVCIPKTWRDYFGLVWDEEAKRGSLVEIFKVEEGILIRPYKGEVKAFNN